MGLDINIQDYDRKTPLHWAIYHNHYNSVEYLLLKNANIDIFDNEKNYPLHFACLFGYYNIVKLLLQFGCEKQIQLCNKNNENPLYYTSDEYINNHPDENELIKSVKPTIYNYLINYSNSRRNTRMQD